MTIDLWFDDYKDRQVVVSALFDAGYRIESVAEKKEFSWMSGKIGIRILNAEKYFGIVVKEVIGNE